MFYSQILICNCLLKKKKLRSKYNICLQIISTEYVPFCRIVAKSKYISPKNPNKRNDISGKLLTFFFISQAFYFYAFFTLFLKLCTHLSWRTQTLKFISTMFFGFVSFLFWIESFLYTAVCISFNQIKWLKKFVQFRKNIVRYICTQIQASNRGLLTGQAEHLNNMKDTG